MSTLHGGIAAPRSTRKRQAENNPVLAFSKILDAPNVRAIIVPSLSFNPFNHISEKRQFHQRSGMPDSPAANPSTSLLAR